MGNKKTIEQIAEEFIKSKEFVSLEIDDIIFEAILLGYKTKESEVLTEIE